MGNGALPSGSTGNASGSGSLVWGIPGKVAMAQKTTPAIADIGEKKVGGVDDRRNSISQHRTA